MEDGQMEIGGWQSEGGREAGKKQRDQEWMESRIEGVKGRRE